MPSSGARDSEGFLEFTLLSDLGPVSGGWTYFLSDQTVAETMSGHFLY